MTPTVCARALHNANHELYYLHQILSMFSFPHGYGADKYNPILFSNSHMLQREIRCHTAIT